MKRWNSWTLKRWQGVCIRSLTYSSHITIAPNFFKAGAVNSAKILKRSQMRTVFWRNKTPNLSKSVSFMKTASSRPARMWTRWTPQCPRFSRLTITCSQKIASWEGTWRWNRQRQSSWWGDWGSFSRLKRVMNKNGSRHGVRPRLRRRVLSKDTRLRY